MFSGAVRRTVALAIVGAMALVLSGCASWGLSQRPWADGIGKLDGVISASWKYRNNWPNSGPDYNGTIVVSPTLTEEQARAIADESCSYDSYFDGVDVTTAERFGEPGEVRQYEIATEACIAEDALVQFAQVSNAIESVVPTFDGEVVVYGLIDSLDPSDPRQGVARSGDYSVTVEASDEVMLVSALSEIHAELTDHPLFFSGTTGETGEELAADGANLRARLSPGDDLQHLMPLITQAFTLELRLLSVTGTAVEVQLASIAALSSPEAVEFQRLAAELEIDARATLVPLTPVDSASGAAGDAVSQAALMQALAAVPGGADVIVAKYSANAVTINTNDIAGVEAAVQLLAAAPEYTETFTINAPKPEMFWVRMKSGSVTDQHVGEIFAATSQLREQLTGIDRIILDLSSASTELTVKLSDSSSAADETSARTLLTTIARSTAFEEVRLGGPNIEFRDEVVN